MVDPLERHPRVDPLELLRRVVHHFDMVETSEACSFCAQYAGEHAVTCVVAEARLHIAADDAALVERARDLYGSDDVNVDEGAKISRGSEVSWVQAWVRVPVEPAE